MKRKDYQEPTMRVVEVQHQGQILVGSPGQVGLQDYSWNDEVEEVKASVDSDIWSDDFFED